MKNMTSKSSVQLMQQLMQQLQPINALGEDAVHIWNLNNIGQCPWQ
jgi:hypothetical protein